MNELVQKRLKEAATLPNPEASKDARDHAAYLAWYNDPRRKVSYDRPNMTAITEPAVKDQPDQNSFAGQMNAADKVVHKVEGEWHYPIMTKYGYEPITKEGTGFVRAYKYVHPQTKHEMTAHTGVSADYWRDPVNSSTTGKNYWADLEPHLKAITAQ